MIDESRTTRYDRFGKLVIMASAGGYILARRPRKPPLILTKKDWRKLSRTPIAQGALRYPLVSMPLGRTVAHVLMSR
jgi:hypothetical protein